MRQQSGSTRGRALAAIGGAIALVVVGCAVILFAGPSEAVSASQELPAVLEIEDGDLRYVYHLPTGQGSLYDLSEDPRAIRNVADDRPEDAERLRHKLEAAHGVENIEALRAQFKDSIDALRRLGYL